MCGSLELEVCVSAVLFDLVYSSQRQLNKLNTVPFRERASFEIRGLGRQQQVKPGTVTLHWLPAVRPRPRRRQRLGGPGLKRTAGG